MNWQFLWLVLYYLNQGALDETNCVVIMPIDTLGRRFLLSDHTRSERPFRTDPLATPCDLLSLDLYTCQNKYINAEIIVNDINSEK